MKTLNFIRKALLFAVFMTLISINLKAQDAFSGTYKGDYNGIELPVPVVIKAAGNGVYNLDISGQQHQGRFEGNQITGTSSAFTVTKKGNQLILTESGVTISLTKIVTENNTENSEVMTSNSETTQTGKVDPRLIGVWVNDQTSYTSGFSHSTIKKIFIEPNGQVKEGSRLIGGGDVGSFDSGLTINYTGVMSAKDGILYFHEFNGKNIGNVQGGTYRFVDKFLIIVNSAGVKTTYTRSQ
jgi:uncharacterized lipoprotein YehR (DUF1307 family)